MGGECDDRLAQVNELIPKVRALVDASISAISTIVDETPLHLDFSVKVNGLSEKGSFCLPGRYLVSVSVGRMQSTSFRDWTSILKKA
jgi:hypothetical protein